MESAVDHTTLYHLKLFISRNIGGIKKHEHSSMAVLYGMICAQLFDYNDRKNDKAMRFEKAVKQHQIDAINDLYMEAFPENERKPFQLMLDKCEEGTMEMLSIEHENQEFLGLAIFVFHKDMALLDYFAIAKEQRGSGVGTKALKYLQTYYEGKRFLLEIEDAKIECDNTEERIRRRAFYLRNGMQVMPFKVDLFGVIMEVLTYKARLLPEEYMRLYTEVFTNKVAENVKIV